MFNLGMGEILVLGVIALIVVGPEKLPSLARNIGRFINDIKRTTSDVTREISRSIDEQEFNKKNSKITQEHIQDNTHMHENHLVDEYNPEDVAHEDYTEEDFYRDNPSAKVQEKEHEQQLDLLEQEETKES